MLKTGITSSIIAGVLLTGVAMANQASPTALPQLTLTLINNTQNPIELAGPQTWTPVPTGMPYVPFIATPAVQMVPAQRQGSEIISINTKTVPTLQDKFPTGFMYASVGQADSNNYQDNYWGCEVQIPYLAALFSNPSQDLLRMDLGTFYNTTYQAPMAIANNNSAYVCSATVVPDPSNPGYYNVLVTVNPASSH